MAISQITVFNDDGSTEVFVPQSSIPSVPTPTVVSVVDGELIQVSVAQAAPAPEAQ